jgi:hypothetical protein
MHEPALSLGAYLENEASWLLLCFPHWGRYSIRGVALVYVSVL